jgi:hypothetical protein
LSSFSPNSSHLLSGALTLYSAFFFNFSLLIFSAN